MDRRQGWIIETNYNDEQFAMGILGSIDQLASLIERDPDREKIRAIHLRPMEETEHQAQESLL